MVQEGSGLIVSNIQIKTEMQVVYAKAVKWTTEVHRVHAEGHRIVLSINYCKKINSKKSV
mgnify:CR=1